MPDPFKASSFRADALDGEAIHWGLAAKTCLQGLGELSPAYNLGFLYVTQAFAPDLGSILTFLRATTRIQDWVGAVGHGVLAPGQEYQDGAAISVMVAALPEGSFRVFTGLTAAPEPFLSQNEEWMEHSLPVVGLVHGDPSNPMLLELLAGLSAGAQGSLVGGLTVTGDFRSQVAGNVTGGGLSGVMFGADIPVVTGLTQGCSPIGPIHCVTESLEDVVMSLDGRPALSVLKDEAGDLIARDLRRAAGYIHVALPLDTPPPPAVRVNAAPPQRPEAPTYAVRSLTGIDPRRGWLAVDDRLQPGDRMMFVRRDPNTARQDLEDMLVKLKEKVNGHPIRGGIYVSCIARGAHMFGPGSVETALISETLGDFPMVGFHTSGEISNDHLFGYSAVLTLFL
ncbi:FIST N-terminal domain-containing protein [Telmatospirillum sp. J64-1]|uniref:FIST signal transduction protein n=1 Tax=Telmatospirillum sp. J64-1 TaxID=2502183 RepID=UPI00115F4265|nr:FIST N-terminal domain-containing protein [Telmatospirillum sp. J64-1]